MFDITLSLVLSVTTAILLAVGLGLSRWQLGRLHGRLSLLEEHAVAAAQSASTQAAQLAALQVAVAKTEVAGAQTRVGQSDLLARVEALESRATGDQPYGDAIRLVRQGAREGRLVDELGLSPMEAALIVRLHGGGAVH